MLDATAASVLGTNLRKIVPPKARRLNSKIDRVRNTYIKDLEEMVERHGMYGRLQDLSRDATFPATEEVRQALERFDRQLTALMKTAEKRCRKLFSGDYDFSPDIKALLDRCHAYKAVLRTRQRHAGLRRRKRNVANAYRFAERCGIHNAKRRC